MPYSVGSAFLQVVPSLRGLHSTIDAELKKINPTVKVRPVLDTTPLRDLPPIRLPVSPDTQRAEKQVGAFAAAMQRRVEAAVKALPDIELNADSSDADRRIAAIRTELADIAKKRIGVDIDTGTAQAAISRLQTELAELGAGSSDIRVQVDAAAAEAALTVVSKEASKLDGRKVNVRVGVDKDTLSTSLIQVAQLGRALGTLAMPAAMIAAAPQLISLAGAATQAAGAVFLLPAAGLAAGAAVGTLAVGLGHVADALGPTGTKAQLEAVNAALAQMSPAARATVAELRTLEPAWGRLQLDVQERLFRGVAAAIGVLAKDYLPLLDNTLTGIAAGFNGAFLELQKWLSAPERLAIVQALMANLRDTAGTLAGAIAPAGQILVQIASIGAEYLPKMAAGFFDLVAKVRDFVTSAEGIAQIKEWIEGGIDAISSLIDIAGNAGGIVAGIFDAAKSAGVDALGGLDDITSQLEDVFNSGIGQDALATTFTTISSVVASLTPGLVGLGQAVGTALVALGPSLPPLADALTAVVVALAPLLPDLVQLAVAVLPPITAAITALAPWLGPVAAGLLGMWAAMKLLAIASAIQAGIVGFTISTGALTATAAGSAGPLALLSGAIRGVGLAIAANPIGIIITVLAAVVAAVIYAYNHFEGFRNVVDAVFGFVVDIAKTVGAWFAGPFVDFFVAAFADVQTAIGIVADFLTSAFADVQTAVGAVIAFFVGGWAGVLSAVGAVGDFFAATFASVQAAVGAAVDFLLNLPANAVAALISLGQAIATGAAAAWNWLLVTAQAAGVAALDFVATLPQRIAYALGFLAGALTRAAIDGWSAFTTGIVTAWDATIAFIVSVPGLIMAGLSALASLLIDAAVLSWNAFTDGITTAFLATVAFVEAAPGRIADALVSLATTLFDLATSAWTSFTDGATTAWDATLAFVEGAPGQVMSALGSLATSLFAIASAAWTSFTDGLTAAWDATVAFFEAIPDTVLAALASLAAALLVSGSTAIDGFTDGVTAGWDATVAFFVGLPGAVIGFFANAGQWLLTVGGDILHGLLDGLLAAGSAVLDFFGGLVDSVLQGFRDGLGIHSPSTVFFQFALDILQGLLNGLLGFAQSIFDWVAGFVDQLAANFEAGVAAVAAVWQGLWAAVSSVVTTVIGTVQGFIAAGFDAVTALFTNTAATISAGWSAFWELIRSVAVSLFQAFSDGVFAIFSAVLGFFGLNTQQIQFIWNNFWLILQTTAATIFGAIQLGISTVFGFISGLFTSAVATISAIWSGFWSGLQLAATTGWAAISGFFSTAFAAFATFFSDTWNGIVTSFSTIINGITAIAEAVWGFVRQKFVDGINVVIDIINKFADAINSVASALGFTLNLHVNRLALGGEVAAIGRSLGGTIEMKQVIRRADGGGVDVSGGGMLPGYTPGRDIYPAVAGRQHYMLGGGEYVVRTRSTEELGPQAMWAINNADKLGRDRVRDLIGGDRSTPDRAYPATVVALAGGGVAAALSFAKSQAGKPYVWGGVGPGGYDCSGFQSAITGVLLGQAPNVRRFATGSFSANRGVAGFVPGLNSDYMIGVSPNTGGGVGHMAGTLGGVNVESRGGNGVVVGGSARGANDPLFPWHFSLPQAGGDGGGILAAIGSFFTTAMHDLAQAALGPVRDAINGVGDSFGFPGKIAAGAVNKLLDGLFAAADAKDAAANAAGGGGAVAGGAAPAGQVNTWINEALRILGYPASYAAGIYQQIMTESGGNPNAVQHGYVDVNTLSGNLARGIMQVIPPTFAANALPGHGNIMNPVDNIIAGSRYAMKRYGAAWFAPGPQHSHGYSAGGPIPALRKGGDVAIGRPHLVGEDGPEVFVPQTAGRVFTAAQWQAMAAGSGAPSPRQGISDAQWRDRGRPGGSGGGSAPVIGELHQHLPDGASAGDFADEAVFAFKHARRGGGG